MPRPPSWGPNERDPNYYSARTVVPRALAAILEQQAERWHTTPYHCLIALLDRVSAMMANGKAHLFGDEYEALYNELVASDKVSVNNLPPIEVGKLHRSTRTKSGFVGVYANGKGYRAMARGAGENAGSAQVSIGTFPTAESAAWARHLHYKKNGFPYGEIEAFLDEKPIEYTVTRDTLKSVIGRDPTDEEIVAQINEARAATGLELLPWEGDLPEPLIKDPSK